MITKYTYISHKAQYNFLKNGAKVLKDIRQKYSLPRHIVIMETVYEMPSISTVVVDNIYMLYNKYPIFVDKYQQEHLRVWGCLSIQYNPIKVVGYTEEAVDAAIREIDLISMRLIGWANSKISINHCDPKIVGAVIRKGKVGLRRIENAIGNGCFIYYSNHGWGEEGGSFIITANTKEYAIMAKISLEERIATITQWHNDKLKQKPPTTLNPYDIMNGGYDW